MMTIALADGRHLVLLALKGATDPGRGDIPADARHSAVSVEAGELPDWRLRVGASGIAFWEELHGPHASLYFPIRTATSWRSPPRPPTRPSARPIRTP